MTNGHDIHEFPEPRDEDYQPEEPVDFESLSPEEQVATLRRDLDFSREEVEQTRDLVRRTQAEMANFRKRIDEEMASLRQDANRLLIMKLLPVIDELELAINHLGDGQPSDSWVEGIKLIHRKAYGVLEAEGLSKIETVGVLFDPLQHEAVAIIDSDQQPSGYVVEAIRNGYRLGDKVIVAAQVVVAR